MSSELDDNHKAEAAVSLGDLTRFLGAVPAPFVVYGPDEKIIVCNAAYQREYHPFEDRVVPGVSHTELQWLKVEQGLDSDAIGREEAFVQAEQDRHKHGPNIEEWEDDAGRFMRLFRERLPDGHVIGMRFDITDLRLAERELQDKNERLKSTQHKLEAVAFIDDLTQLSNRRGAIRALETLVARAEEEKLHIGVVLYDLNGFKQINDGFGHAAGDALLREIGARLQNAFDSDAIVARMGGDEFLVTLASREDNFPFQQLVDQSMEKLSQPFVFMDFTLQLGVNAGIAIESCANTSAESRIAKADMALHDAKKRRGNISRQFDEKLRQKIEFETRLRQEILSGVLATQTVLHFQPIVDAKDPTSVPAAEVLVRWDHPEFGLLAPGVFFPVVEALRMAHTLDEIVLDLALGQITKWQSMGQHVPKLSVNISPQRLLDDGLSSSLDQRIIPKDSVSFEILETVFSDRADNTLQWNLDRLHDSGIELHIDDYGTSHSSISSLLLIRPKRIKIDRQFCARVAQSKEARDIVRLTVALAKSLGISVTAEGVEDFETAERLAGLGCDMLQGYLFGKPCPATAFPTLLHGLSGEKIA